MSIKNTPPLEIATVPLQRSIIGTLLLNKDHYYSIAFLHPVMFAPGTLRDLAQEIWVAIDENNNLSIAELRSRFDIIDELINESDVENLERHGEAVKENYIAIEDARIFSAASARLIGRDDYSRVISDLEAERELLHGSYNPFVDQRTEHVNDTVDYIYRMREAIKNGTIPGRATGYDIFDRATLGHHPGNLIIVAARPGMGKTDTALEWITNNLQSDNPEGDGIIGLEMMAKEYNSKLAAKMANLSFDQVLGGNNSVPDATPEEMALYFETLSNLNDHPLFINDRARQWPEIKTAARKMVYEQGITRLFIDYLQLVKPDKETGNRHVDVGNISRGLKALAKELKIPIIAFSQLSRAVEVRGGNKRPQLSDLRESGNIEEDADMVSFIYRPEKYGILENENGDSLRGLSEIFILKNRILGDRCWSDWRRFENGRQVAHDFNNPFNDVQW